MPISNLDWINQIDAQVNKFLIANGGPTSNPLISIDAQNLKTLIAHARNGIDQSRPVMGTTPEEALKHYQQSLQKQVTTNGRVPQKAQEKPQPALEFPPKPQPAPSYINAVITKLNKDDH